MARDGVPTRRIEEQHPRFDLVSVLPREARANDADARVALLLGAVSLLVLVMACANVANLQLARGLRRRRELAVRSALGAGAGRLVQQLFCEGALLAVLGGAAALAVVAGGAMVMRNLVFPGMPWEDVSVIDLHVLSYAAAIAIVVGVLTGLVPAIQARRSRLTNALKEGVREGRVHHSTARLTLLTVQAALSVVMLVGTGLFVRSLRHVEALPIGMEPSRVITVGLNTNGLSYTAAEIDALYRRLERSALGWTGVASAAVATSLHSGRRGRPESRCPAGTHSRGCRTADHTSTASRRVTCARWGCDCCAGNFTLADENPSRRVVIVNDAFARLAWPNEDAIGRCVRLGGDTVPCAEVIGVVANPRRQAVIEDTSLQLFLPRGKRPPGSRLARW